MANPVHLGVLRRGVEAWNRWRVLEHLVRPDLRGADLHSANLVHVNLSEANLRGADLHEVDLRRADLTRADLSEANLVRSDLSGADLAGANLQGADLYRADLIRAQLLEVDLFEVHLHGANLAQADLSQANLAGADLHEAILKGADLTGADLRGAALSQADLREAILIKADVTKADLRGIDFSDGSTGWTMFGDVDLGSARGLDTVTHSGPSTIGIDTIYRSDCNIPEAFLRGAGVPEGLITYVCSLAGQTSRFHSHFISYSNADQGFAQRLHADLRRKNVRCWLIPKETKTGDRIRTGIDESVRLYDKLLLVLSEHSLASDWLEQETRSALVKEHSTGQRVLFPIRVDDAAAGMESGWAQEFANTRHIADFRQWQQQDAYQEAFGRLLRDLETDDIRPS
jgi:uncharacterized protein YjbI with pentapeptide repeats